MKWLILESDYDEFLEAFYSDHPGLAEADYAEQVAVRQRALFGIADVYAKYLVAQGEEAHVLYINNEILQRRWAHHEGLELSPGGSFPLFSRPGPGSWFSRFKFKGWNYDILAAQIRQLHPDLLFNLAMPDLRPEFLREMKAHIRLLAGQHAATPLNPKRDWSVYDLILSSFPPTVDWCKRQGIRGEFLRLGFEPTILDQIAPTGAPIPVSFVGSFSDVHTSRTALLESLARQLPISIWGPAPKNGFLDEGLSRCYRGPAWGRKMFEILASSHITINHHGNVPPFANNMRLYEATGVGTLLLTDAKANLRNLFEPGREVIAYETVDECRAQIEHFLNHEYERSETAKAGQRRTLREHRYDQRVAELVALVLRLG